MNAQFQIDLAEGSLTIYGVTSPAHEIYLCNGKWTFSFTLRVERNSDGEWTAPTDHFGKLPTFRPDLPRSLVGTLSLDPATGEMSATVGGKKVEVSGHYVSEYRGELLRASCHLRFEYRDGKVISEEEAKAAKPSASGIQARAVRRIR